MPFCHFETVCLLRWEKAKDFITIDLPVAEIAPRISKRATYQEIKDYVFESSGLRVSTLNIAQMKEKYGIKERENYNHGSGKNRVPQCTLEKEKAIVEAFKHFRMI